MSSNIFSMWNVCNNAYACIHYFYDIGTFFLLIFKSVYLFLSFMQTRRHKLMHAHTHARAHTHAYTRTHTNVACHAQRAGLTTILVVSPTRELAMQIEEEARKLCTYARE